MDTSDAIALASLLVAVAAFAFTIWANLRERTKRELEIGQLRAARRAEIVAEGGKPPYRPYQTEGVRYGVNVSNAGRTTATKVVVELLDAEDSPLQARELASLAPEKIEYVEFKV